MDNTSPDTAYFLHKLLVSADQQLPPDDYNHHEFIKPLQFSIGASAESEFSHNLDNTFLRHSKGQRNETYTEKLRHHWKVIFLNLCMTMYQRHWLLVPASTKYYSSKYWPKRLGLSYRPTQQVIKLLKSNDFITVLPGKRYKNQPVARRIYPTAQLQELLWEYFLSIEQPIEPPYLTVNDGEGNWSQLDLPDDHPEVEELTKINEFLKGHRWAFKGPIRLLYKHTAFQGGRLYTPFQNLPDRSVRLRINTRINDHPIGEVDFNANHLRLNLAFNGGVDAGESPYEDIGEAAGGLSRDTVKSFITIAMGANEKKQAASSASLKGINGEQFTRLTEAALKVFPKLELFSGWGLYAQNLEGQILKQVMLEGVKKDIVCLPVHDAVAVQQERLEWAKDTMLECWDRQMETTGLARVKVDLP